MFVIEVIPHLWSYAKIYEVLPDAEAAAHGLIRVIDESGEDYLYPKTFFVQLDLSQPVETAIRRAS